MYKFKTIGVIAASVTSIMLLISGCSSAPENTAQSGSESTAAVTLEESKAEESDSSKEGTRTISTSLGDVEVPANPQRVIATYGMGDIIALGVIPVASYDAKGTAYEKEVAEVPVWSKFEAEEIMSYDPDLILVVNQEQYDEVSKIAPTVIIPFTELSMEERVTFLGEILNKQDEAKKALSDFKEKIAKAKETLDAKGIGSQTFSIFEYGSNGGIWVYGDKWGRGGDIIYSQLGLHAPDIIQKEIIGKDQYREVSMEAVNEYAGNYIVFSGETGDLSENPVWDSIPAVKAGNVIYIDDTLFYDIDLYSSSVQLEYLMKELLNQ